MRLLLGATLAFALNAPGTSLAQQPSWWIAPGGGIVWIPNEFGVKANHSMFGAILGKSLGPTTAIELRGIFANSESENPGGGSLDLFHGSANFTWFRSDGAIRPYLTGGAGLASLTGAAADSLNSANGGNDGSRVAWNGGIGLHIPFSDNIALRLDGREVMYKVYVPSEGEEKYQQGPEAF